MGKKMGTLDQRKNLQGPDKFHASSDALVKVDPSNPFLTRQIPRKTDIKFLAGEEVSEDVREEVSLRQFTASDANSSSIPLKAKIIPLTQRNTVEPINEPRYSHRAQSQANAGNYEVSRFAKH